MVKVVGQLGMDETLIEDEALEAALEKRAKAQNGARAAGKRFGEADAIARGLIEALALGEGVVARVGRFRIERKTRPPRHVEFDSLPGESLSIREDVEPS